MAGSQDTSNLAIRSLPHDDDAEKLVLGALLLDCEAWDEVAPVIGEGDFYSPANRMIFSALYRLVNEEGKTRFDGVVLINYLRQKNLLEKCGGVGYISSLTSLPFISSNIREYCSIIKDASYRRMIFKLSNDLQTSVFDPSVDIRQQLETDSKEINDALLSGYNQNAEEYVIGKAMIEAFQTMVTRMENNCQNDRIETGFSVLDRYTNGGFAPQEYVIIAARPSIGKTAFALSMMYNMINNDKKVAFFSLEMPSLSIANRMLAMDSKVELSKILKSNPLPDEFELIKDSIARFYDKQENMYIVDVPNINLTELRTKARLFKKEKNIDCLVIDYIGLISPPSYLATAKKFEQVSQISLSLKQLARELKIPVVVLCQVGRESEEQEPILSNLRDSGSIEQDADIVCFLHRKKTLSDEEKQKNLKDSHGKATIQVTKMIVAKNRNGETGYFKIGYNGPITLYTDVAQSSEFIDYDVKTDVKKKSTKSS